MLGSLLDEPLEDADECSVLPDESSYRKSKKNKNPKNSKHKTLGTQTLINPNPKPQTLKPVTLKTPNPKI
jgi:hypothetical protein